MSDEETGKRVPFVAFNGVLSEIDRMGDGGIPDKFDKKYLADKADGTQFQYRQAFRYLGLTTTEDRPTQLLEDMVTANQTDRRGLLGKIMSDRYPELTGLPPDASKNDFFAVLEGQYGVASDVQRRKMLTFFVAAADYAELPISPGIRPTKARTGSRKSGVSRGAGTSASRSANVTPRALDDRPAERREISLGDAGSVSIDVNVRWLDLSEDQFTKLRKLIKDIEALGDSGT